MPRIVFLFFCLRVGKVGWVWREVGGSDTRSRAGWLDFGLSVFG